MVTECNNPDSIKQKNAADMTFKEMMEEMQANTPSGTRVWCMLKYMDFSYDDKQKEIDSLRKELKSANAELALLKQEQTNPLQTFRAYQCETPDVTTQISKRDQILAYCVGMSEGVDSILHYIEHTDDFENCEMV